MDGSVMRVSASVSLWSVGELEAQRMGTDWVDGRGLERARGDREALHGAAKLDKPTLVLLSPGLKSPLLPDRLGSGMCGMSVREYWKGRDLRRHSLNPLHALIPFLQLLQNDLQSEMDLVHILCPAPVLARDILSGRHPVAVPVRSSIPRVLCD